VADAFDVVAAQRVGVGGAAVQFGLHNEGDLEGARGEGVEQQAGNGLVDDPAGHGLAALPAVLDAAIHALVVGDLHTAAGVVAHRHAPSAAPADGQALQQRGALAGGTGGAVLAVRGGVGQQQFRVGFVLVPAQVAGVGVGDQRRIRRGGRLWSAVDDSEQRSGRDR
jgi:L-aminopeptidase/D-esterase-like protein